MKENNPQLLASTERATAPARDAADQQLIGAEPLGSFIALKRLTKLDVEAVRMQGCADGAAAIDGGGDK